MSRTQASIGAAQYYGPRTTQTGLPSGIAKGGPVEYQRVPFTYEQANAGLPTVNADEDAGVLTIPAGALVQSATLYVTKAFASAGAATLEIGAEGVDGSVVDADGFDSLAVAALTEGSVHVLDGALVGASVGSAEVQVAIDDGTAEFTAGEAVLVIEYLPRLP